MPMTSFMKTDVIPFYDIMSSTNKCKEIRVRHFTWYHATNQLKQCTTNTVCVQWIYNVLIYIPE